MIRTYLIYLLFLFYKMKIDRVKLFKDFVFLLDFYLFLFIIFFYQYTFNFIQLRS